MNGKSSLNILSPSQNDDFPVKISMVFKGSTTVNHLKKTNKSKISEATDSPLQIFTGEGEEPPLLMDKILQQPVALGINRHILR